MVDVGEKIKKVRKLAGLTQSELAKKINMSQSYIADIERDRQNPSLSALQMIANALNVDIAEFVGNSSEIQKDSLTNEEIHLVAMWRSFDDEDKSFAMQMFQRFKKNARSTKLPITGMIKTNRAGLASGRA